MDMRFVVEASHAQPRPAGRRKLPTATPCSACREMMHAGSNAYEIPGDESGRFWHKRCLHGRSSAKPTPAAGSLGRRGGTAEATRSTICNVCRERIKTGDDIVALAPHRWAHVRCGRRW